MEVAKTAGLPQPRDIPDGAQLAIQIWNQMGGEMQWTALPFLSDLHGIDDPELLIAQLIAIRDVQGNKYGGQ